jgi:hypothetical protein
MNGFLKEYYKSPVIKSTNQELSKNFWSGDYQSLRLPYVRGFAFALYLNCKIKSQEPLESIDLILLDFWKNHKTMTFSNENFIKLFKKDYPATPGIEKWFDDYIVKGQVINLAECCRALPLKEKTFLIKKKPKADTPYYFPNKLNSKDKEQITQFFKAN